MTVKGIKGDQVDCFWTDVNGQTNADRFPVDVAPDGITAQRVFDQRITKASVLVMATGFPALITRAACWEPWSGLVRADNASPDTTIPATSAATTILTWVERSAL
jgi:hypothetical protein